MLAVAASLLLDGERLAQAQAVDAALLADLESLTADLARRQHHAQPQAIRGPIRGHLEYLLELRGASMTPSLRLELARVTAETAAVAGWVAFRGHGDLVTAHGQLSLGRQHAREAGDDVLMAQLLAASSSLHSSLDLPRIGEDQRSRLALSLLHAAQRKAAGGPPPLQGWWLAARVALEQALFGEGRKARGMLTRAEATLSSCPPGAPGGLFVIWDETRFPGYAGKTLLVLGDQAATTLLERALAMTSAPHPRLGLLVDLAMAWVHDGEADDAVTLLLDGARLAVERGRGGFARWRLREGRAGLPAAHQRLFDNRIQELA